jgi:GNAT superfamily N-acetyltransferase
MPDLLLYFQKIMAERGLTYKVGFTGRLRFMVAPEWRGRGLGTALQNNMVEHAIAHGIRGFSAVILSCNAKAMALAQKGSKNLEIFRDGEVYEVINYF